ncbi:hypothetical protein LINPERPRIM_LOCUS22005 [Linum perenne]
MRLIITSNRVSSAADVPVTLPTLLPFASSAPRPSSFPISLVSFVSTMTLLWLPVPRLAAITWTFAESPSLWRGWNSITMTKRFLMVLWWFPLVGSIPFLLNWVGCLIPSSGIPLLTCIVVV